MFSTHLFDLSIDAVQSAGIITLAAVLWFRELRIDHRFAQQHRDVQDVIKSQYDILKTINDQGKQIVDHQMQIDGLKRDVGKLHELRRRVGQGGA